MQNDGTTCYPYSFFVKTIRDYFSSDVAKKNYNNLTPFQAEFYIWPEIQICLSAEELLSRLTSASGITSDEKKTSCIEYTLEAKLIEVLEKVKKAIESYKPAEKPTNDINP